MGLLPAVALIVGVAVVSQYRPHTAWRAALIPVATITGIAVGAQHYLQGRTCAVSRSAVESGTAQHQGTSATCMADRVRAAFAHLWPYALGCLVALAITAALAVAFGRADRRGLSTPLE